jgi:hypothetical protein
VNNNSDDVDIDKYNDNNNKSYGNIENNDYDEDSNLILINTMMTMQIR